MTEQNNNLIIQVEGDDSSAAQLRTSTQASEPIVNIIEGTDNPDILFGTPGNDQIFAKGDNDTIFGSLGDDLINGGAGFDTLDYSVLGQKITLLPQGLVGNGSSQGSRIQEIEKIIGAKGKDNTIDGSGTRKSPVFFTVNLADKLLIVENIPGLSSVKFEVENFVNVEGTENFDSVTGNNRNNKLSGNGGNDNLIGKSGNDSLIGGSGNDTLIGADPLIKNTTRPEKDVLTGGTGADKFVLGNELGSFYDDFGNRDFATITDFSFGDQIQLGSGETYNIQRNKNGFNIFLIEDSGRDLIAKVTLSLGITDSISTNNAMMRTDGASFKSSTNVLLSDVPQGDFTINSGEQKGIFVA
ncbi:MAG: hypothetical protein VKN72_14480 [Nostocales cyanobacterium 94392]|nr:hypothetical protein [Nostocales cyanobacterium 94392]